MDMDKKKGSAIVLAILLLSFFMALSLNMWYVSQKKAQRAGDIIQGNRVLMDIDAASTLGYYELYIATEYMVNGFVTKPVATNGYTLPTTSSGTFEYVTSTGALTTTIEGIGIDNERQYFGTYISTSGSLSTNGNALLHKEVIASGKVQSRTWEKVENSLTELWLDPTKESLGGYKLKEVKVDGVLLTLNTTSFLAQIVTTVDGSKVESIYEKTIKFNSGNNTKNSDIEYKVRVTRESTVQKNAAMTEGYVILADSIKNIVVELQ